MNRNEWVDDPRTVQETQHFFTTRKVLREARLAGLAEIATECRDELECIELLSEQPRIRAACRDALADDLALPAITVAASVSV